jgi:hypothetical protein
MGKEGRGGFERQGSKGREKQYFSSGVQIDVVSLSVGMETVDREKTVTGEERKICKLGGKEREGGELGLKGGVGFGD